MANDHMAPGSCGPCTSGAAGSLRMCPWSASTTPRNRPTSFPRSPPCARISSGWAGPAVRLLVDQLTSGTKRRDRVLIDPGAGVPEVELDHLVELTS